MIIIPDNDRSGSMRPYVSDPNFVENLKRAMDMMADNPDIIVTLEFPDD